MLSVILYMTVKLYKKISYRKQIVTLKGIKKFGPLAEPHHPKGRGMVDHEKKDPASSKIVSGSTCAHSMRNGIVIELDVGKFFTWLITNRLVFSPNAVAFWVEKKTRMTALSDGQKKIDSIII